MGLLYTGGGLVGMNGGLGLGVDGLLVISIIVGLLVFVGVLINQALKDFRK